MFNTSEHMRCGVITIDRSLPGWNCGTPCCQAWCITLSHS